MKSDTVKELIAWTPPKIEPIISSDILYPETKMIMYGSYKSWKSMIAMHCGFCIASDRKWFSYDTKQGQVLLIQCEIPKFLFRERILAYAKGNDCYPDNLHLVTERNLRLDKDFGLAALNGLIEKITHKTGKQLDVLILDPIYKLMSGGIGDSAPVQFFLDNIDNIIDRYKCAVILVTHQRKTLHAEGVAMSFGADEIYGPVWFPAWLDTALNLERSDIDYTEVTLNFTDVRNAKRISEFKPFTIKVDEARLRFNLI